MDGSDDLLIQSHPWQTTFHSHYTRLLFEIRILMMMFCIEECHIRIINRLLRHGWWFESLFHLHWYLDRGSSPPTFGADGLDEPGTCVDRVDRSALIGAFVALHV